MTDDILREALQGMRQPQPGAVYIADVLAYVEPEMERLRLEEMFGNQRHSERLGELERTHDERQMALAAFVGAEADRDRARDIAVALEQENAQLTKQASRWSVAETLIEKAHRKGYDPTIEGLAEVLGLDGGEAL